eukprot:CAMPEP_0180119396 /NCGR_PEP_ID=MMETSP0986-20121125/1966_1 /TAXON_ID=697907 /ORGANISM="non described non described, Strain CCMP2293" /LENGTH=300 /DNA_ID=CAMNT_0022058407 /DNA_START=40 /DNA_END=942 /DNA_ORIENTATION=+
MVYIGAWMAVGCRAVQSAVRSGAALWGSSASANLGRASRSPILQRGPGAQWRGEGAQRILGAARGGGGGGWCQLSSARRFLSSQGQREAARLAAQAKVAARNRQVAMYMGGVTLFTISFTYLSVPLYRVFCQKTGFAGTIKKAEDVEQERARPVSGKRILTIKFNADVSDRMPWKFAPQQHEVKVLPGEAALCFFTATNRTDSPIIGVSSYNVQPEGAALYFNKIQCFCFEEQLLKAREKIDMPVFFFIDPSFLTDKAMTGVDTITLSYTFFRAGDPDAPEIAGMLNPHPVRSSAVALPA